MQPNQDPEYIDQYLRDELDEQGKSLFEKRLKEDPMFAQEVRLHQKVKEVVTSQSTHRLDQILKDIQQDWEKKNPVSTHSVSLWLTRPYSIAAAIILIMAIGALVYTALHPSPQSSQELFYTYYKPSPLLMQRGQEDSGKMEKAFEHYLQGEYDKALNYFEDPAIVAMRSIKVKFYAAHCYLNMDEVEKASQSFEEVIKHGDNIYMKPAHWYLALAYLKENDISNTIKLLTQVDKGMYESEAQRLLKDLERLKTQDPNGP